MHTKNPWILRLGASQSIDYGAYGLYVSQCRKHLRPQHGSTVRCFILIMFSFNNSMHGHDTRQLLDELCLIHERGVRHGDLRAPKQNGSAHFIDFSHGYEHQCTGRVACTKLIEARRFLLLNLEHSQTGQ
jgi:hypothetical protein